MKVRGAALITVITPSLPISILQNLISNFNTYTNSGYSFTVANCNRVNNSNVLTTTTPNGFANAVVGMRVTGTGIAVDSFIVNKVSNVYIELSKNATSTGTFTVTIASASVDKILATDQLDPASLKLTELYESNLTQASLSPFNKTKVGFDCELSISIADDKIDFFKLATNAIAYNVNTLAVGDQAGLTVGNLLLPYRTLIIQPYVGGVASNNVNDWFIIPYASPEASFDLAFGLKTQRKYQTRFVAYDPFENGFKILKGDPLYLVLPGLNTAPTALDNNYSVNEDGTLNVASPGVLGNDSDPENTTLTAYLISSVSSGTLNLNSNGSFTYVPNSNFNGTDIFTYRAFDGQAFSNLATVTITVNSVNDPPVAVNNNYSTNQNQTLTVASPGVLGNDTDADGNTLTTVLVSTTSNGTLTLNSNGSFTYVPNNNFNGTDLFTYRANDGTVNSNIATVTITVNATTFGDPGFLNDYPGANLALSLRRSLDSYNGVKIRVRRSSDDLETNIGLSGNTLDTVALLNFCGSGNGFVVEWHSEVNGLVAYQPNPSNQPQIVNAGNLITVNSRPSISFNGSQWLIINDNSLLNYSSNWAFLLVGLSTNTGQSFIGKATSTTSQALQYTIDREVSNARLLTVEGTTVRSSSRVITSALSIINAYHSVDRIFCAVNNVNGASTVIPAINLNNGTLNIGDRFGTRRLVGNVSELLFYPTDKASDLSAMNTNLNTNFSCY